MIRALRLALLRGQEQSLHRAIAAGYAQGRYMSRERALQQKVRREIRDLERSKK